jgi:antitoxin (DNA-binding transcriptional repressor) of toxin-antitoxin stability system
MRHVDVAEAGNQLRSLLAAAHGGEEVLLTEGGQVVGRLVAEAPRNVEETIAEVQAIHDDMRAKGVKPFTAEEVRSLINEGRRY